MLSSLPPLPGGVHLRSGDEPKLRAAEVSDAVTSGGGNNEEDRGARPALAVAPELVQGVLASPARDLDPGLSAGFQCP